MRDQLRVNWGWAEDIFTTLGFATHIRKHREDGKCLVQALNREKPDVLILFGTLFTAHLRRLKVALPPHTRGIVVGDFEWGMKVFRKRLDVYLTQSPPQNYERYVWHIGNLTLFDSILVCSPIPSFAHASAFGVFPGG